MALKFFRLFAILLLLLNGAGALFGGGSLIIDPAGRHLQLPIEWLQHTPFKNFLIPGILLFFFNGILSLLVVLFTLLRKRNYALFILAEGGVLIGWILIELMLTQHYNPLQLVMGIIGILLLFCGWRLYKINKLLPDMNNSIYK